MYDVIDPEDPGHTVPSRMALRGQRPGLADVEAARRCRLRHVEVGEGMPETVRDQHPSTYIVGADIYGRVESDRNGRTPAPVRADDRRLTGNGRFLTFDRGLSLDHAERLRPPDHRWGDDGRTHVWDIEGLGTVMSGPEGIGGSISSGALSGRWTPEATADAIACLAAAQDDQRCRFGRGVEGDTVAGTEGL